MSTRDMNIVMNDAFKQASGQLASGYAEIGHYLPLVAEVHQEYSSEYGSTYPHVGQLLIINENEQSWNIPCNIEFTYDVAEFSGWTTGYSLNRAYDKKVWNTGSSYTGYFSIPTGTRRFAQHLFTGMIYDVRNITVNDPKQDLRFYILGDDGVRLLHGMENETNRNLLDKAVRSLFVAPPECVLCEGTGIYESLQCPQCLGVKYLGYNAEGWLLTNKAKELGVYKRDETDQAFQHRAWAEKQWVMPNVSGITNHLSLLTGIPTGEFEITAPTGTRDLIYYVRFPLGAGGTASLETGLQNTSTIFDTDVINEVLQNLSPAGTNPVLEPYYSITDLSEFEATNAFTAHDAFAKDNWNWGANFHLQSGQVYGSGWQTSGYNPSTSGYTHGMAFFESDSRFDDGDSFYTGTVSGLTSGEFDEIFLYDNCWTVSGNTGYATGTLEDGYTGIYITGTEVNYR